MNFLIVRCAPLNDILEDTALGKPMLTEAPEAYGWITPAGTNGGTKDRKERSHFMIIAHLFHLYYKQTGDARRLNLYQSFSLLMCRCGRHSVPVPDN